MQYNNTNIRFDYRASALQQILEILPNYFFFFYHATTSMKISDLKSTFEIEVQGPR